MPVLMGEHILLREFRQEDYQAIAFWMNNWQVTRYLSTKFWIPQTTADVSQYLTERLQSSHNAYYFVIAESQSKDYLGQIDLYSVDWRLRCATLGLIVIEPGKGYGTEALRLMRHFAFDTLGLERLELEVHEDNLAALRCYEKAGFIREGIKRNAYFSEGRFRSVVLMSALREDEMP